VESNQVLKDYSFWGMLLRPETENELTERAISSGNASEMYSGGCQNSVRDTDNSFFYSVLPDKCQRSASIRA
jgi:hypothetical protein